MSSVDSLLIEIGTEELPPQNLGQLAQLFADKLAQVLQDAGMPFTKVENFVTPRRLAVRFAQVPAVQPPRKIHRKGPALAAAFDSKGNPLPPVLGFARSCGVDVSALKKEETPQGAWMVFEQEESGKHLPDLLPKMLEDTLNSLPGKRMRWGDSDVTFLRPIHWILAMHGTAALSMQVLGLTTSNQTRGHRFHFPQPFTLKHADHYEQNLKELRVMVNHSERQATIRQGVQRLGEQNGGQAVIEEALLDQVTGLVEWPVPMYAHFDKAFLEVPQEALVSSMQNHQKCFAIQNSLGKLVPTFIMVSNTEADPPKNIIQGNERVMHARLADAKFFYDQDRKTPLASRLEGLQEMVFQKKLGTLYDKCHRVAKLASQIATQIGAPAQLAERAGRLCKADLLTEMVYEFPELQGIMGYYYALHDGEPTEVAVAIKESYFPRFAKDELPESPIGICVALADRLDSLIGIFGIGQMPTGDKDPFGLRRQALGILRILIEKGLTLDLSELCHSARHGYGALLDEEVVSQVVTFCFDRLRAWYHEQDISPQTLEAVLANQPTQPYDCSQRLLAVSHFQTLPEAQNLAAANKRVRNILQKGGIVFNAQHLPTLQNDLLQESAEKTLAQAIETLKLETQPLIQAGKYQEALIQLAQLQKPVDHFFDQVMVMTEDEALRKNRVTLLSHLSALFMQIADISKLAL